ncbi:MAG: tetratricopeptide repeat protein [Gemmatimonadales bacterium]
MPLSGEIEPIDGPIHINTVAREARRTDGLELEQSVEPELLVVDGLSPTQYESGLYPPPDTPAVEGLEEAPDVADAAVELPLILPEDVQPGRPSAPRLSPPRALRRSPNAGVLALSDDDGAADTTALSQAEPVVTETIAELYARQGHTEEALRVYHALLEQRPGDPGLRGKIARLTAGRSSPATAATGQTARAFLRGVLHGLALAGMERVQGGATATSPTGGGVSLDAVFGAEVAPPAAPAVPTTTGGFSFDDFFSTPAASGERAPSEGSPAGSGSAAYGGPPRPGGGSDDRADLDEFQRWLQGLRA